MVVARPRRRNPTAQPFELFDRFLENKMAQKKILIADDDRDHLLMLTFLLRKAGYQVVAASDVTGAMQMAAEHSPDLLILDVHMGADEGFAIQEKLFQFDVLTKSPVIYLTGDQSDFVHVVSNSMGAHVITKPFNSEKLLSEVETLLNKSRAEQTPPADSPRAEIPTFNFAESYVG
jgi:DNA-binding response OmpR family regulator